MNDTKAIPMEMAIYKMVSQGNDHLFVSGEIFKILSDGSLVYDGRKILTHLNFRVSLAQMVEQETVLLKVEGSYPTRMGGSRRAFHQAAPGSNPGSADSPLFSLWTVEIEPI